MMRIILLIALAASASACSSDSSTPTPTPTPDLGSDTAADAGEDASDATSDAAADATSDVTDSGSDSALDGGDAGVGDLGDVALDMPVDMGPPPTPPCDATLIGPNCDRQYMLDGLVSMAVYGDNVYLGEHDSVLRLDRVSGQVDVFSTGYDQSNLGAPVGAGPPLSNIRFLSMKDDGSVLYVYDSGAESVVGIDTTTGDRTTVSDASDAFNGGAAVGTGIALDRVNAMTWDPMGQRLLVAETGQDVIMAIDIATGDRTVISDNSHQGVPLAVTRSLVVDSQGTIFGYEQNRGTLYRLDRTTGDRTIVSAGPNSDDAMTGAGVDLSGTRNIVFDSASGLLFLTNTEYNAVLTIDPATGDREIFSQPEPVVGLPVGAGSTFYYPFEIAIGNGELLVDDSHQEVVTSVDLATGDRTVILSSRLGNGYRIGNGTSDLQVSANGDTLYALLESEDKILAIDTTTMDRIVIADDDQIAGSGAQVDSPSGLALDGTSLYFTDDQARSLVRLDTATLVRTVVSDDDDGGAAVGTGPALSRPTAVVVDSANNRALVSDRSLRAVIAIDLTTGNRTVISDDEDSTNGNVEVGTGPEILNMETLALDAANNRLFVADSVHQSILVVDLATGNRTVFSDAMDNFAGDVAVGTGPAFGNTRAIIVDSTNGRLLVADSSADPVGVYAVDLATGNRTIYSGPTAGQGWLFDSPAGLAHFGDTLYVSDRSDNYIMSVSTALGTEGDRWIFASGATIDSY